MMIHYNILYPTRLHLDLYFKVEYAFVTKWTENKFVNNGFPLR